MTRKSERTLEYRYLDSLMLHPENEKGHDIETLKASMLRFGFTSPVEIDERTKYLGAGHGRVEALIALRDEGSNAPDGITFNEAGKWMVPVVRGWRSKNDAEARAHRIADNQIGILGGWKIPELTFSLTELVDGPGLDGVGFGNVDLVKFLAHLDADPESDEDDLEIEVVNPVTKRGNVWLLGEHALMCGDCRSARDVKRALGGGEINLAITSPPYAEQREYDAESGFEPIPPNEYVEWFAPVAGNVSEHLASDGSWFVNIKASAEELDTDLYVFDLVIAHVREWGWHFATEYCWERNGVPKSVTRRFKNQFEPVYQFTRGDWKMRPEAVRTFSDSVPIALGKGAGNTAWSKEGGTGGALARRPRRQGTNGGIGEPHQGKNWQPGTHTQEGLAYPGNRLPSFTSTHEAVGHPAAFPVGLPKFFIMAYTDEGDVVFDPFVGSGSTLLAAEDQGRVGIGMELSPKYCDMALARFERRTGITPILKSTGKAVSFADS